MFRGRCSSRTSVSRNFQVTMKSASAETVVDRVDLWVRRQTFNELLDKAEVRKLLTELSEDDQYWKDQRQKFNDLHQEIDQWLRTEKRPLNEILSADFSNKIFKQVESSEIDPAILKAFMRTPAVESMAGAILYTGILEFMQRADILGNIVNQLPVIGPIRQEVNKALRDALDSSLGPQVKEFLGTQSRPAVEQMIQFILDEKNSKSFSRSAKRLAEYVMSRPVNSLMPSSDTSIRLRDELWEGLRDVVGTVQSQNDLLDTFFDKLGDREVGSVIPEFPSTGKKGLLRLWQRFLDSEGTGLELTNSHPHQGRQRDLE